MRAAKAQGEAAAESARRERLELQERLAAEHLAALEAERKAHASARAEWEAAFEGEVARRMQKERSEVEEASAAQRTKQIGVVVDKLGAEMAAAEAKWAEQKEGALNALKARHAEQLQRLQMELTETQAKYMAAVETHAQLQARLREVSGELSNARAGLSDDLTEARAQRDEALDRLREARDAARDAEVDAGTRVAQVGGERAALAQELTQLRAEHRTVLAAHAEELASARALRDTELSEVEHRVVALTRRKDSTIGALQGQGRARERERGSAGARERGSAGAGEGGGVWEGECSCGCRATARASRAAHFTGGRVHAAGQRTRWLLARPPASAFSHIRSLP